QGDQRKGAPRPPPGGKSVKKTGEPDEGGDQEKDHRRDGCRGGDDRQDQDWAADAGANLGVQGEVTEPAAHSFNSSTPKRRGSVDGWAKPIYATWRRTGIRGRGQRPPACVV